MSKKAKQPKLYKLRSSLATLFVLAIFIAPVLLSAKWAEGVFGLDDPRKTTELSSFNVRQADLNKTSLQPFNEAIISVTFDDGWESVYSNALPIMQKYGIHSTQYILAGQFDDPNYFSEAQVRSLAASGHEIASHTVNHLDLTTLDDTDLAYEIGGSKDILGEKFGIPRDFAPPLGADDQRVQSLIKQNYRSARNTTGDISTLSEVDTNTRANFNRYSINAFTMRADTSLEQLQTFIAYAQANNAWIVITYHQVDRSGSPYSVTPETFESQMKLLHESTIRSAPLGQVIDAIDRRDYVPSF